jgi:dephospho-CoA kinase
LLARAGNNFLKIQRMILGKSKSKRLIGLTGGIATGKTTVSRYLTDRYQIPVLDADIYAKEAVKPGSPILNNIFSRWGDRVKLPDNTLDRQQLGEIVFNDLTERQWLEAQIHPYVRDRFNCKIQKLEANTIVLAIPLLFEAKMTDFVTEVWLVYCSPQEQIKRLIARNNLTQSQAIARIDSQLPIEEKVPLADLILDNSSTVENLYYQIDKALSVTSNQ